VSGSEYAVEWNDGAVVSLLGLGHALAINNSGEVVGQTCDGNNCHAANWIDGVSTRFMDLPPGSLSAAFALNADGQTVGFSQTPLPPIPEPSTWAMMLIGFAGLSFMGYLQTKRDPPALS
jgi:uncharacterized membrane protein